MTGIRQQCDSIHGDGIHAAYSLPANKTPIPKGKKHVTRCSQQPGPNLPALPQTSSLTYKGLTINLTKQSFGGDQTGAVMISKFIKPGTVSTVQYNHYSMLKSIEDIFQLDHLGYAGQADLVGFGGDIFTNL